MNNIILYTTDDGKSKLELHEINGEIWLSQLEIAELYQTSKQNISLHVQNVFEEGELLAEASVKDNLTVQTEGSRRVKRTIKLYSLPLILAVGYRVRSTRGTQFRKWATATLQEYLVKGFIMDDERLKNPPVANSFAPDYFDELLERIRDIRASERRVYLRVTDIFKIAADYIPGRPEVNRFFQTIQNKLHFAVTGMTAAEIINTRANASKPNMGLTSFKGAEVLKGDVTIAKNYLTEPEIRGLNRIVNMWLDFAEDQAQRRKQVFLQDWTTKLDQFLEFNDREVLIGAGNISKKQADERAKLEYDQFAIARRQLKESIGERSDFYTLENILKDKQRG